MIWFFIKKNFFDGWENIINILVPNIITVAIFALTGLGFYFFFSPNPISILIIYVICLLAIALIIIFVSAFSENPVLLQTFYTDPPLDFPETLRTCCKRPGAYLPLSSPPGSSRYSYNDESNKYSRFDVLLRSCNLSHPDTHPEKPLPPPISEADY